MKVLVVGAGIMGSCAALSLVERGHAVTVIDRSLPGQKGASWDYHRLIRLPYGDLPGYDTMVVEAWLAWERLWRILGASEYLPSGMVVSGDPDTPWISKSLEQLRPGEYQMLGAAEVGTVIPGMTLRQGDVAFRVQRAGILLADRLLRRIHERLGATITLGASVSEIDHDSGEVHLADGRKTRADRILVCTGAWPWPSEPTKQVSRTPSRQTALYLEAPDASWANRPFVLDLAQHDGFYFVPPVAGTPAKMGTHAFSMVGEPSQPRECTTAEVQALLDIRAGRGSFLQDWPVLKAEACYYDVSPDQRFVASATDRAVYIGGFSGHGFKFAPLIGERIADFLEGRWDEARFVAWLAGRAQ